MRISDHGFAIVAFISILIAASFGWLKNDQIREVEKDNKKIEEGLRGQREYIRMQELIMERTR